MIRVVLVSLLTGLLSLGVGLVGWAADNDGSKITIVSPAQGAVIKGDSVEVRYKLSQGTEATHIHCYVDGEYQRGFKGVVKGLTPGAPAAPDREARKGRAEDIPPFINVSTFRHSCPPHFVS
ncbi:MAG: hypothetical protein KF722_12935 [Nitrospira sp.]|nr:hypothetical protein [Nitrospira sp.]